MHEYDSLLLLEDAQGGNNLGSVLAACVDDEQTAVCHFRPPTAVHGFVEGGVYNAAALPNAASMIF